MQSHSPLPFLPCCFFACRPRRPALPKDSLICLPVVAFLTAWSPDKEKQWKACVSENWLHHHWNDPVHSIIYCTLPLPGVCMWVSASLCVPPICRFLSITVSMVIILLPMKRESDAIAQQECMSFYMNSRWVNWREWNQLLFPTMHIQRQWVATVIYLLQVAQSAYQEHYSGDSGNHCSMQSIRYTIAATNKSM